MKRAYDDPFARKPRQDAPARHFDGTVTALGIIVLTILSAVLLVLSRFEHSIVHQMRMATVELLAPALKVVSEPLAPLRRAGQSLTTLVSSDELERLRAENDRLKGWEARARELERRLADLRALSHAVEDQHVDYVTARVIADASGPFARSLLVNAGREKGIREGCPVIGAAGVVGRIIETGPRAARVLLLTDLNSRVPVLVGGGDENAILVGENGPLPKLTHLRADAQVADGDAVVTSGIGGEFARGLRVGTVRRERDAWRVDLDARLDAVEHVSVLLYETPVTEPRGETPSNVPELRSRSAVGYGATPPPSDVR